MVKTIDKIKLSYKETYLGLFLISFLSLFLELSFIRYTPANITSIAYFNNIIMIACLFGLGLGCLLSEKKIKLIHYSGLSFLAYICLTLLLKQFNVMHLSNEKEVIYWLYPRFDLGLIS